MKLIIYSATLFLILSMISCGSEKSATTADTTSSAVSSQTLTGSYYGTETGTQNGVAFSQVLYLILTQVGSSVSGTWQTGSGTSGTATGTVSGDKLKPLNIISGTPCSGTYSGNISIIGNRLSGTITGSSNCGVVSAVIDVSK